MTVGEGCARIVCHLLFVVGDLTNNDLRVATARLEVTFNKVLARFGTNFFFRNGALSSRSQRIAKPRTNNHCKALCQTDTRISSYVISEYILARYGEFRVFWAVSRSREQESIPGSVFTITSWELVHLQI